MLETNFSATEPSLGYYYQLRYSLYLLLNDKEKDNPVIKIESLDDISIGDTNSIDLYQTKLHIKGVASLTDSSPDFWKTIRVWSSNISNKLVEPENTLFTLLTTAPLGSGTFLYGLSTSIEQDEERDVDSILKKMVNIAKTSTNRTNKASYGEFLALNETQQKSLISRIQIIDRAIAINEVLPLIKKELRYSTVPNKLDHLTERLEGWWFQRCIDMLNANIDSISARDLRLKINDIQDSFQADNLPDDFANPLSIEEDSIENHEHRKFIIQLKLIAVKSHLLRQAINDFRRAFEQRSRWIREELINPNEEELYESRLLDHWKSIFALMKDDCEGMDDFELIRVGLDFYKRFYIERVPPIRIRERFNSEYVTRGSCHILADKEKIGWHPDYLRLLPKIK